LARTRKAKALLWLPDLSRSLDEALIDLKLIRDEHNFTSLINYPHQDCAR